MILSLCEVGTLSVFASKSLFVCSRRPESLQLEMGPMGAGRATMRAPARRPRYDNWRISLGRDCGEFLDAGFLIALWKHAVFLSPC